MNELVSRKDLTRWNRAGLQRFNYVDGNAITYLEELRLAMRRSFTDEDGRNQWSALDDAMPEPVTESASERQARWIAQYRDDRRDYAWEILRTYARSAHVLTEYLHVYANEGYLRTATQWYNVRRLVEMLDYHPAPPASAETTVAIVTKDDKSGLLETGFAFKNKPEDGSKPVVFETLADLDVDYRLNELRLLQWNKSQEPFVYDDGTNSAVFPLAEPLEGVAVGGLGVLLIELPSGDPLGLAVTVTGISDEELHIQGEDKPAGYPARVLRHQLRLLLSPRFKQASRMTGSNVVSLTSGHGLATGSTVAWQSGGWQIAHVEQVDGDDVRFSRTAPAVGTDIYLTNYSEPQVYTVDGEDEIRVILPAHLNDERFYPAAWDENLIAVGHNHQTDSGSGAVLYDYLSGDSHSRVYYVPQHDAVASVQTSSPQGLELDGNRGDLATGDWLVVDSGSDQQAAEIESIVEADDSYKLTLSPLVNDASVLYGKFALDLRPRDYDRNDEPIFLQDLTKRSDTHSWLPIELADSSTLLSLGRRLIVEGDDDSIEVTVREIDPVDGSVKVEPAIPGSELAASGSNESYSRYLTKIYGNAVQSGHGETRSQKILGSGDATQAGQEFVFDIEEVSHVVDTGFPQGVRAAVEVTVGNRTWQQVPTLNDSDPEQPHYVVRMQEDGTLLIAVGQGGRGRRLPSGNNNVRIVHRVGAGLSGNLPAYSLEKEVKPHHLVEQIVQPLAATGGNAMESAESMRDNAPASVLTLERAVSLSDFSHLATANSGVWQARAFRRPPGLGRADKIEVVVVPAGGGALGSLEDTLKEYLQNHALPGVQVTVVPYRSLILDLTLELSINSVEYDPDFVVEATRDALINAFALEKAQLGVPLYRSQVFAVVEGVEGVENCRCVVSPYGFRNADGDVVAPRHVAYGVNGEVKRISPAEDQVIYMDEAQSIAEITTRNFSL